MTCPKCGSEEWKLAWVIHAGGISTISTTTVGVGTGVEAGILGGGVGFGTGVGKTSGKQQTELSKLAAPPTKVGRPASAALVIGLIVVIPAMIFGWGAIAIFFGGALAIGAFVRLMATPEIGEALQEEHRLALLEYEKKRMCLRCGSFFFDSDNNKPTERTSLSELNGAKVENLASWDRPKEERLASWVRVGGYYDTALELARTLGYTVEEVGGGFFRSKIQEVRVITPAKETLHFKARADFVSWVQENLCIAYP